MRAEIVYFCIFRVAISIGALCSVETEAPVCTCLLLLKTWYSILFCSSVAYAVFRLPFDSVREIAVKKDVRVMCRYLCT